MPAPVLTLRLARRVYVLPLTYAIYLRITDIISEIVEKYPFLKDFGGKFVTYALLTTKNERYLLRLSFPFYV